MMFNKQELQEMFEKQVDAAQVWLETVNAQALTIQSQQTTIRNQDYEIGELKEEIKDLRRKLYIYRMEEQKRKDMN